MPASIPRNAPISTQSGKRAGTVRPRAADDAACAVASMPRPIRSARHFLSRGVRSGEFGDLERDATRVEGGVSAYLGRSILSASGCYGPNRPGSVSRITPPQRRR